MELRKSGDAEELGCSHAERILSSPALEMEDDTSRSFYERDARPQSSPLGVIGGTARPQSSTLGVIGGTNDSDPSSTMAFEPLNSSSTIQQMDLPMKPLLKDLDAGHICIEMDELANTSEHNTAHLEMQEKGGTSLVMTKAVQSPVRSNRETQKDSDSFSLDRNVQRKVIMRGLRLKVRIDHCEGTETQGKD